MKRVSAFLAILVLCLSLVALREGVNRSQENRSKAASDDFVAQNESVAGYIEDFNGEYIRGWAIDNDYSGFAVVSISVDGVLVARVRANSYDHQRPDLFSKGIGNREFFWRHNGFGPGLHRVRAWIEDVDMNGIPTGQQKALKCWGENCADGESKFFNGNSGEKYDGAYGWTDVVSSGLVSGWVVDKDSNVPVVIEIYVDGKLNGVYKADKPRSGLSYGSGNNGFEYPLNSIGLLKQHELHKVVILYRDIDKNGAETGKKYQIPNSSQPFQLGDLVTMGEDRGNIIRVQTSGRLAGTIESLKYGQKEFVNDYDHGRQVQYAIFGNGKSLCYNPNEAGGGYDGFKSTSTSRIIESRQVNGLSSFETKTQMAYWVAVGSEDKGPFSQCKAENTKDLSDYVINKKVSVGYKGIKNVVRLEGTWEIPEYLEMATFSNAGIFLAAEFNKAYTINPKTGEVKPIPEKPQGSLCHKSEEISPVMMTTADGSWAISIYAPMGEDKTNLRLYDAVISGCDNNDHKKLMASYSVISPLFRTEMLKPGKYKFETWLVVGKKDEVVESVKRLAVEDNYNAVGARGMLDRVNCNSISGWVYDPENVSGSVKVEVYLEWGGQRQMLGEASTTIKRAGVAQLTGFDGVYGFGVPVTDSFKDGVARKVVAYGVSVDGQRRTRLLRSFADVTLRCVK